MNSSPLCIIWLSFIVAAGTMSVPLPGAQPPAAQPRRMDQIVNKTLQDAAHLSQQLEDIQTGAVGQDADEVTIKLSQIAASNGTARVQLEEAQILLASLEEHIKIAATLRANMLTTDHVESSAETKKSKAAILNEYKTSIQMYRQASNIIISVLNNADSKKQESPLAQKLAAMKKQTVQDVDILLLTLSKVKADSQGNTNVELDAASKKLSKLIAHNQTAATKLDEAQSTLLELKEHVNTAAALREANLAEARVTEVQAEAQQISQRFTKVSLILNELKLVSEEQQ